MAVKFVAAVFLVLAAMDNVCQAGKSFGGGGGIALVNQVRFQVVATQQQIKLAIDTANTTIQTSIAVAQNGIDAKVKASQDKVAAANVPACANGHNAAVSQVNSEALNNCDQAGQFQLIDVQVTLFNSIHAQLSTVYTLCPFWGPSNQVLCIQNFCEGMTTQITDHRDAILSAVDKATTDANQCIATETQKANAAVAVADTAFNDCRAKSSA